MNNNKQDLSYVNQQHLQLNSYYMSSWTKLITVSTVNWNIYT